MAEAADFSKSYLTLVTWPEGLTRRECAALLQRDAGLDEQTLYLQLGKQPPAILGLYDSAQCRTAIESVVKHGGDAFACTLFEIEALGANHKIRDLRLDSGILRIDLWRGSDVSIEPKDIQILIRAKLSQTQTKPPPVARSNHLRSAHMGFALGGAYGMTHALYAFRDVSTLSWDKTFTSSDKLDIHLIDGTIYQIDGDKFGFRILGDQRGYSDNENIDKMCEFMAQLAPDEIVDPYFSLWSPPPGHGRLRIPLMKINNDDPAFAFYSRWAALMYRHVMGEL